MQTVCEFTCGLLEGVGVGVELIPAVGRPDAPGCGTT